MRSRFAAVVFVVVTLIALPRAPRAKAPTSDPNLTVHEWGTFTSIAGKDGRAIEWLPLSGSPDLPAFVEHYRTGDFKVGLRGTVRMETPVLYFYTNRETTVSVHVAFSRGLITEWYPHATRIEPEGLLSQKVAFLNDVSLYQKKPDSSISWDAVELEPGSSASLLGGDGENHYYAARKTASTPLRIKTPAGYQSEKFLFYRGVSSLSLPISARLDSGGKVLIENSAGQETLALLLFERRGNKLGFRMADPSAARQALAPPELTSNMDSLEQAVEDMLIAQGLYLDEARAMFETWRDSWFEEGSRLLYIVPRQFVDSVLPLSISPAPAKTVRVFVGRLELVTPATEQAVEQALASHDRATLTKYNRFLVPIVERIIADEKSPKVQAQLRRYFSEVNGRS